MRYAEKYGTLSFTAFVVDGAPDRFRLTVTTPLTRSIKMSLARVLTVSGLAADKAGCFLTALVGDGAPVESRLSVGRGLKRRACAA